MHVDLSTAILTAMLVLAAQTVILCLFWVVRRSAAGMGLWLGASLCQAASMALFSIRGRNWDDQTGSSTFHAAVSVWLPNLMLFIAALLIFTGVRRFLGMPQRSRMAGLLFVSTVVVHFWFTFVEPDIVGRSLAAWAYFCAVFTMGALNLFRQRDPEIRFSAAVAGVVFFLMGLLFGISCVVVLLTQPAFNHSAAVNLGGPIFLGVTVICMLWTFSILLLVYQRQHAQLEKFHRESVRREGERVLLNHQSELAQTLHDGMGSSTASIAMIAGIGQLQSDDPRAVVRFEQIAWLASEAGNEIQSLLGHLDAPLPTRARWLREWRDYAERLTGSMSLRLVWESGGFDERPMGTPLCGLALLRSLKECLHNAIRHSGATEITLSHHAGDSEMQIRVMDNGSGIPHDTGGGLGRGLSGLHKRAGQLGGRVEISGEAGTCIDFTLPLPLQSNAF